MTLKLLTSAALLSAALTATAQSHVFDVKASKPGAPVQSKIGRAHV